MAGLTLEDLEGNIVLTNSGRWVRCCKGIWKDEFHQMTYLKETDEPLQKVVDDWPRLREGMGFQITSNNWRSLMPSSYIMLKTDEGFRFRVQLKEYQLTIPFLFNSSDERVGEAEGQWSHSCGQLFRHLINQPLHISYDEKKPVLHVGWGMMTVPSQ